jgi:hypothetical protein
VLCMEITAFLLDSYEALKHMVNDHGEWRENVGKSLLANLLLILPGQSCLFSTQTHTCYTQYMLLTHVMACCAHSCTQYGFALLRLSFDSSP